MEIKLKRLIVASFAGVLCLIACGAFAQVKRFSNVKGVAAIVNITPEEAKTKAIEAAKVEAMRLAGVTERIKSFNYLEKKESNGYYEEYFHSLTSVETQGSVIGWQLVDETKKLDDFNNLIYEVTIDATVQLYKSKTDPEFYVSIEGLDQLYKNESNLTFTVQAKKAGYLKIFLIDGNRHVSMLFPNEHESALVMEPDKEYHFPRSPHFDYEVYTEFKEEQNYLFFLFTRKEIPYRAETFQEFIEYVYSIEPQDRFTAMEKIMIYR